jgi:hypothetical protein
MPRTVVAGRRKVPRSSQTGLNGVNNLNNHLRLRLKVRTLNRLKLGVRDNRTQLLKDNTVPQRNRTRHLRLKALVHADSQVAPALLKPNHALRLAAEVARAVQVVQNTPALDKAGQQPKSTVSLHLAAVHHPLGVSNLSQVSLRVTSANPSVRHKRGLRVANKPLLAHKHRVGNKAEHLEYLKVLRKCDNVRGEFTVRLVPPDYENSVYLLSVAVFRDEYPLSWTEQIHFGRSCFG